MALLDRIQKEMTQAMKARDEGRLGALRLIKTALKKHEVDSMKPLDEAAEMQVMKRSSSSARRPRRCSARAAAPSWPRRRRPSCVVVESFLPGGALGGGDGSGRSRRRWPRPASPASSRWGLVMKAAQARLAGKRVDGKLLSDKVRARLS